LIIWQQAEIIPKILDVAPIVGPPPMKIRVVRFCTLPLVATSKKTPVLTPPATRKWKMHFYVETEKTLVPKVVGHAKMHISTKNVTMFP
jgi:hypothetical protein